MELLVHGDEVLDDRRRIVGVELRVDGEPFGVALAGQLDELVLVEGPGADERRGDAEVPRLEREERPGRVVGEDGERVGVRGLDLRELGLEVGVLVVDDLQRGHAGAELLELLDEVVLRLDAPVVLDVDDARRSSCRAS